MFVWGNWAVFIDDSVNFFIDFFADDKRDIKIETSPRNIAMKRYFLFLTSHCKLCLALVIIFSVLCTFLLYTKLDCLSVGILRGRRSFISINFIQFSSLIPKKTIFFSYIFQTISRQDFINFIVVILSLLNPWRLRFKAHIPKYWRIMRIST